MPEALRRFAETDRAVLLGTQMVAKGHHFAGVSLAAVVDADTQLGAAGLPRRGADVRSSLTQLAGRSGRDAPGRVIVQTFQPDARAVAFAARHDVAGFLAGELERRRELGYPPFCHLVRIVVAGADPEQPLTALRELASSVPGGRAARARAAASPARALPRAADREDRPSRDASRRARAGCSPRRLRRCAAPGSPRSSTSTRRASSDSRTRLLAVADEAGELRDTGDLDAEAHARRRMALAQIRQYPDPALRMRRERGRAVRRLAAAARRADDRADGRRVRRRPRGDAGRRAPARCSSSRRATTSRACSSTRAIVQQSDELEMDDEGCLSLQRRARAGRAQRAGHDRGRRTSTATTSASSSTSCPRASCSTSSTISTGC